MVPTIFGRLSIDRIMASKTGLLFGPSWDSESNTPRTYSTSLEFALLWLWHDGTVMRLRRYSGGKKLIGGTCSLVQAVRLQA